MIILAILVYKVFNSIEMVSSGISFTLKMLIPFFWAFAFAYLINPLMVRVEKKMKVGRGISLLISYFVIVGLIALAVAFIAPAITSSLEDIAKNAPMYAEKVEGFIDKYDQEYQILDWLIPDENSSTEGFVNLESTIKKIAEVSGTVVSSMVVGVVGFTTGLFKVLIGLIISIYFLKDKEKFVKGIKKILFAMLSKDKALQLCEVGRETNVMFSRYFVGKLIDSLIIGVICYFGMLFIKAPYPMLLALIIGITNMIPFFGPFIGAVPAVIISLFTSPITALWVAIYILILQQVDGYIIGPKVLGDSVGLSPFWIILAIIVGGALFGILGMLVGVPIMALIRNYSIRYFDRRVKEKNAEKYI